MCGGNVIVSGVNAIGICENCGSTITVPTIDDERRANLFNRANHFRRQGDFDKALAAYEIILSENNDLAEAHWGAALCRYGVEYVEDPDTHNRIPTCHRTNFDSILADLDYQQALSHADPIAKTLYEKEAKQIDEIQRGILAISQSEQPFDIFISYKETTDGGARTKDSVLAQNLYDRLIKEGYQVFFSRVTLEDKVGAQYEPFIFSALNSAKVMLVVGTDPDHFKAPWVKNEWGRYLSILKKEGGRLLIPCFKDMTIDELPEELTLFQCQDMSKIGFEQDLIRGIKKVFHSSQSNSNTTSSSAPSINSLSERAELYLKDGNWVEAARYYDQVLDIDPHNGRAYAGKVCAQFQAHSVQELTSAYISKIKSGSEPGMEGNYPESLSDCKDFQKAVAFAGQHLAGILKEQGRLIKQELVSLYKERLRAEIVSLENRLTSLKSHIDELVKKGASIEHDIELQKRKITELENNKNTSSNRANAISGISLLLGLVFFIIETVLYPSGFIVGVIFFFVFTGIAQFIGSLISAPSERAASQCAKELEEEQKKLNLLEKNTQSTHLLKSIKPKIHTQHLSSSFRKSNLSCQNVN